jgi:hypothetical protein
MDIFILLTFFFMSKCFCENFYLKLIVADEMDVPLVLTHHINDPEKYGWYKYIEQDFIENLNQDFLYKCEIDEVNQTNSLKIYDLNSNQLDHYQLKIKPPYEQTNDEIIYTIGFIKNLHIETNSMDYYMNNSTCILNVILPIGLNNNHMDFLTESIQRFIDLETNLDDQIILDTERKKRNTNVFELEKSKSIFDRFVYQIQINTPSITVYSTNGRILRNISCELLVVDYEDRIYKKKIFKTLGLLSNSARIDTLLNQKKILFTLLLVFYKYIEKSFNS